jgi:hypothetical protein
MAEGYEDIDKYVANYNQMLDKSLQQQNEIVNKQTQMQVDSLGRQKEDIDRETIQQNKALYQDYKKNSNPFGQQAENLAGQGLANSGYAETTQARMYNTYQNNITATLNNARQLKADVDFQIQQARQTGDITLAQNALQLFNQRMQLLSQEYDMRNNREQFLYQKQQDALAQRNWQTEFDYNRSVNDRNYNYQISRDKVADTQWQKNYDYQKSRDKVSDKQWNKTFNYQKSRDKVSDSQWQKEYELSKKAKASSSRSSEGSRRSYTTKKSSSSSTSINTDGGNTKLSKNAQNVLDNVQELVKGLAKGGLSLASIVSNLKSGNASGALKTVKKKASDSVYNAYKKGNITEEEAEAIAKKLGL